MEAGNAVLGKGVPELQEESFNTLKLVKPAFLKKRIEIKARSNRVEPRENSRPWFYTRGGFLYL